MQDKNHTEKAKDISKQTLDALLSKRFDFKKIEPIVKDMIKKFLGVNIDELTTDISKKVARRSCINVDVDISLSFKESKRKFKRDYIVWLLRMNRANISKVAKIAGVDRRSIHRIISNGKINVDKMRKELLKPSYVKKIMVDSVVEKTVKDYANILHPVKVNEIYNNIDELSKNIANELHSSFITLKEAEEIFEEEYLRKALSRNNFDISKTAKEIKLRYETLHRKAKQLNIL